MEWKWKWMWNYTKSYLAVDRISFSIEKVTLEVRTEAAKQAYGRDSLYSLTLQWSSIVWLVDCFKTLRLLLLVSLPPNFVLFCFVRLVAYELRFYWQLQIESKVILSTKLSVEGPLRLKEEYIEGILETPSVSEQAVPEQLKSAFNQVVNTVQQLPVPIKDVIAGGLRVPLTGSYQRLMMISYLDEEILIIRDTSGVPEVLTRLDSPPTPLEPNATEYES